MLILRSGFTSFVSFLIIMGLIYLFSRKNNNSSSKKNSVSYKKYNGKVVFYLTITLIFAFIATVVMINRGVDETTIDNNYLIGKYDVTLDVNENNTVDVTEEIGILVAEDNTMHGIFRFIPRWLKYTDKNGHTLSRKAKITNPVVENDFYVTSNVNGKLKFKIGNASEYLESGVKEYVIKYTYDFGKDPYNGFDEFIFHTFGDHWSQYIYGASVTINMPKDFDSSKVSVFLDKYRKEDASNYFDYTVEGKSIYIKAKDGAVINNALTVDIELPDGYFKGAHNVYGYISLTCCIAIIMIMIINFISWFKHGKEIDSYAETVELYPPNKLDPASLGYIYKGVAGNKLTIATIVSLASKGLIKIDDNLKDKDSISKGITVTNLVDTNVLDEGREVVITKTNNAPINDEDKALLEKYFKEDQKEVKITNNFVDFFKNATHSINNKIIDVKSDSLDKMSKTDKEKAIKEKINEMLGSKGPLTKNEEIVYFNMFRNTTVNNLYTDTSFYRTFSEVNDSVEGSYENQVVDVESYKHRARAARLTFVSFALFAIAFLFVKDLNMKYRYLYYIAGSSIAISFILTLIMKRKSDFAAKMGARINGFKNYLITAEKDQLVHMVEENPSYFYDILPYAYVLGITNKWIKKFENIPIPEVNMGNFDYTDYSSFDRIADVYTPHSSSSGSGCSSCGGGCSSCGGGCSSCGGGGSW